MFLIDEKSHEAYTMVKKMIVTKKLMPGETIVQEKLASLLGIDESHMREALRLLESESILISTTIGSMTVRELSTKEILQIFDCRIALEIMAVKLFAQNALQEKIDDLRNLLVPFEKGPININVFQKIDLHFHDIILRNCGNPLLYDLFGRGNLFASMELIGLIRNPKELLHEYLDIVSAIHYRNADKAVVLMQQHLEKSKQFYIAS